MKNNYKRDNPRIPSVELPLSCVRFREQRDYEVFILKAVFCTWFFCRRGERRKAREEIVRGYCENPNARYSRDPAPPLSLTSNF